MAEPWRIYTLGEATLSAATLSQAKSKADRGRRRATSIEHEETGERWSRNELRGGWRCTRAAKYGEAEDPTPPPWWVLYAAMLIMLVATWQPALAQRPQQPLWAVPFICAHNPWRCSSMIADRGICRRPGHVEGRYCVDEYVDTFHAYPVNAQRG